MKLGKAPARHDKRTLKYEDFTLASSALPVLPQAHWGHGLPYTMLGNDQYGDCVEAAYAHMLQTWIARSKSAGPYTPDDTGTLAAYSALTGFNPANPSTDRGTDMLSACNYWRTTGMNGYEIDAFLSVNPQHTDFVKDAVAYYGGLYIGAQLPVSAQAQSVPGGTWSVTTGPDSVAGSWGGHCIPIVGYDKKLLYVVTWGMIVGMTWGFLQTYCDEAFVFLAHEWIENTGFSPGKMAWGQLTAALANLGH